VGNIVPVPTGRGVEDIELLKIDRRKLSRHSVHKQPTPRCHCQHGPGSSGRLSFTGDARRTTNRRSGTSCGAPTAYSFTCPSITSARNLNGLRRVRPDIVKPLHRTPLTKPDDSDFRGCPPPQASNYGADEQANHAPLQNTHAPTLSANGDRDKGRDPILHLPGFNLAIA
jgi:hypothetical protein